MQVEALKTQVEVAAQDDPLDPVFCMVLRDISGLRSAEAAHQAQLRAEPRTREEGQQHP